MLESPIRENTLSSDMMKSEYDPKPEEADVNAVETKASNRKEHRNARADGLPFSHQTDVAAEFIFDPYDVKIVLVYLFDRINP